MTSDAHQVEGRDGKAGSSSTSRLSPSRQTTKRRKLEHRQGDVSEYFSHENPVRRGSWAIPSTSTSSRPSSTSVTASANPIIIEDDVPATNGDSHEPILLRTSSPDPMEVISPNNVSYVFDQNKPSPVHAFSSCLEEKHKSPQDGKSTLDLCNEMKKSETRMTETSDGDNVRRLSKTLPGLVYRDATTQTEASSGWVNVKEMMAIFDGRNPWSKRLSLKNSMKPKQVGPSSVM